MKTFLKDNKKEILGALEILLWGFIFLAGLGNLVAFGINSTDFLMNNDYNGFVIITYISFYIMITLAFIVLMMFWKHNRLEE